MSAITSDRLRVLRADVLERGLPAGETRRRADAYLDAVRKAPTVVLLWALVRDIGRYSAADSDLLRVILREANREGWR